MLFLVLITGSKLESEIKDYLTRDLIATGEPSQSQHAISRHTRGIDRFTDWLDELKLGVKTGG